MIALPESVSFYYRDPANQAAINLLVGRADPPLDLALDEVEQFEVANLAAQRVRLDFWRLLRRLWSASWHDAVSSTFPQARLATYGEHQGFQIEEITPSVEAAWDGGATYGLFHVQGVGQLVTSFTFTDKEWREPQLSFYLVDLNGGWSVGDGLDLGPDWDPEPGWRLTQGLRLTYGSDEGQIDPKPLADLAQTALQKLFAAVTGPGAFEPGRRSHSTPDATTAE